MMSFEHFPNVQQALQIQSAHTFDVQMPPKPGLSSLSTLKSAQRSSRRSAMSQAGQIQRRSQCTKSPYLPSAGSTQARGRIGPKTYTGVRSKTKLGKARQCKISQLAEKVEKVAQRNPRVTPIPAKVIAPNRGPLN